MSDLTEFLLARISEDEKVARMVDLLSGRWSWASVDYNFEEAEAHGTRWSPTRILAECGAKRRIIELHTKAGADDWYRGSCRICGESDVDYPCDTLKALALPYAEHSDYRAEWAI